MKVILIKETVENKCKESHSLAELARKLGCVSGSFHTHKRIGSFLIKNGISFAHFDPRYSSRQRRIYTDIIKKCPVCETDFLTRAGHKDEKTYCSQLCCNKLPIGNRFSEDSRKRTSLKLTKPLLEKVCEKCGKNFWAKRCKKHYRYCSISCSSLAMWDKEGSREKQALAASKRIKEGKFGWIGRKKLSFPEQIYKNFLEENGFSGKFIINHPVSRKKLDGTKRYYYLDFYFPELKIDLEIDGQQHKIPERQEFDTIRDNLLSGNGYFVFRLDWKEIITQTGKAFLENQKKKLLELLTSHKL